MPATTITAQSAPTTYSTTGTAVTMNAVDTGNGNDVVAASDQFWIVQNTDASPQTFTMTSAADARTGRTGDVSAQSLAASEVRMFRTQPNGWADSAGKINFTASSTNVKVGIINL